MDFTALLLIILALIAVQNKMYLIAVAILVLLLLTSKSKIIWVVALIGGLILAVVKFNLPSWLVIVGLFVILVLIAHWGSTGPSGPENFVPGGY